MFGDKLLKEKYKSRKRNARARGKSWSLTFEQFKEIYSKPVCYYTGRTVNPRDCNNLPSLERVDCNIGYEVGNVVMVHESINKIKSMLCEQPNDKNCLTVAELLQVAYKTYYWREL